MSVECTVKLSAILAHKAYVDFRDIDHGITQLLQALNLARQKTTLAPTNPTEQVARVIHSQLTASSAPVKPKPPQIVLRAKFLENLSIDDVKKMLKEKDFYHCVWNASGKGLRHEFEPIEQQGQKLVIDHATGLMWQQADFSSRSIFEGSRPQSYDSTERSIRSWNEHCFAGYNDWRLPTLEEAMSLMESKKHDYLYLDPVFHHHQQQIWTADKESAAAVWVIYFDVGNCVPKRVDFNYFHFHMVR